ncbi:6438_t:CDS:2, partial [Entrophospora sp. SA101]
WEWSLHNATQLKISNTVPSIGKHLINCENFATINPDELESINSHLEMIKRKRIESRLNNSIKVEVDADADVDFYDLTTELDDNSSITSPLSESSNSFNISHINQNKRLKKIPEQKTLSSRQSKINEFIGRPLRPNEETIFNKLLLKMTISNGWSFHIQQVIETAAKEDQHGVTISLDGWKNVAKQNILGFVLTRSDGQVLIWGAEDISCQRSHTEAVVQKISEFINTTRIKNIKINDSVTDSASAYNAARKKLRIYKDIIFLPCFAHQTNLCIADILKSSSEFLTTSRKAEVVVSYFNASTFFLGELCDEQLKIYGSQYSLVKPGKTRWNSYYMCYNSILKNKRALRVGINELGDVTVVNDDSVTNQQNNVIMANRVLSILEDPEFWGKLAELEALFYPYCLALNTLQKNKSHLFEVLHCFGYFMEQTLSNPDDDFKDNM